LTKFYLAFHYTISQ